MSKLETLRRLRMFNSGLAAADPDVLEAVPQAVEATLEAQRDDDEQFQLESIALRRTRPVLAVRNDDAVLEFADPDDIALWRDRLVRARASLVAASRAVGRIDLTGHDSYRWIGTGWLVDPDVVVTNRHVAIAFANGEPLEFLLGFDQQRIRARVDFVHELGPKLEVQSARTFRLTEVLFIEPAPGPDLAFFRVEQRAGTEQLATPIALAPATTRNAFVATIGYPARDSRLPDQALMEEIFRGAYDGKRLAPGKITHVDPARVLHDCSTLGGNSGSAVIDLATGDAVGLHFRGTFLVANDAVPSAVVQDRLDRVLRRPSRGARMAAVAPPPATPGAEAGSQAPPPAAAAGRAPPTAEDAPVARVDIPITISIAIGPITKR